MTDGAGEFVTVAEAAAMLGITERSVRRRMAGLGADSVRRTSGGSPARLSMAEVETLRRGGRSRSKPTASDPRTESGGSPAESGTCPAVASARLAELVAEVAWLRGQLEDANRARAEERRLYLAVLQALPPGPTVATHNDIDTRPDAEPHDAVDAPENGSRGRRRWPWPWRKTR